MMRPDVTRDDLARAFIDCRHPDPALRFCVAEASDDAFLEALYNDQREREFAGPGLALPASALAGLIAMQRRAQAIGYAQRFPNAVYLVIRHKDEPVGRLTVDLAAEPLSHETVVPIPEPEDGDAQAAASGEIHSSRFLHVVDIVLLHRVRERGLGRAIMQAVIGVADAIEAPATTCTVARTNLVMRRLTASLQFAPVADDGEAPFLALRRDRARTGLHRPV